MSNVRIFLRSESGAVTADWVVLSAVAMFAAAATVMSVKASAVEFGPRISAEIESQLP